MYVVTGSFGNIGKYITRELLNKGHEVKTVTSHPNKPSPTAEPQPLDRTVAATYTEEKWQSHTLSASRIS